MFFETELFVALLHQQGKPIDTGSEDDVTHFVLLQHERLLSHLHTVVWGVTLVETERKQTNVFQNMFIDLDLLIFCESFQF